MFKEIRRVVTTDERGQKVNVVEKRKITSNNPAGHRAVQREPSLGSFPYFFTDDGKVVNPQDDGTYQINDTGEILTPDEPATQD